jgi:hypothetical protein
MNPIFQANLVDRLHRSQGFQTHLRRVSELMTVPDTEKLLPEIDGAPAETAKAGPQPRTVKTVKKSPMKKVWCL